MGQFIFEIILLGIIDPLVSFFDRKHHSGQWHISHLLPLIIVLFGGMWWLGSRLDSVLLMVLGISGAVISFFVELFLFIPRGIEYKQDFDVYVIRAKRKKEAESKGEDSSEKE